MPVGSFPLGRSGVGAVDLIGNAWEWVEAETLGSSGQVLHAIKGGAFDTPPKNASVFYRSWVPEDRRAVWNTGFRCARRKGGAVRVTIHDALVAVRPSG